MKKFLFLTLALLMLFSSCTDSTDSSSNQSTNSVQTSSPVEKSVTETALSLVNEGKIKEAYVFLYNNRDNKEAEEMLSDFTVVYTDYCSKGYEIYNAFIENVYNEHGDMISRIARTVDYGRNYCVEYTYEHTYDSLGNKLTSARYDKDDKKIDEVINYTYDQNGNLLCKEEISYGKDLDGNDTTYIEYYNYTYDANGNILSEINKSAEGDINYSYIYAYDENGNMTQKDYYNTENNFTYSTFVYNENNQLVQEINVEPWGKELKKHTLNDHGDVVKTEVNNELDDKDDNPEAYKYTYEYEYEYDENGNKTKFVTCEPNGTVETEEYIYDKQGNVIKNTRSDNSGKIRTLETVYEYHDDGSVKKESITQNNWSQASAKYTYDDHGNWVKLATDTASNIVEFTYYESGKIATELKKYHDSEPVKFEYTYDENGNVIKTISYNPDKPDNKEFIDYTYDSNGKITAEHSYIINDETELENLLHQYTYDANGNLIKEVKDYYGGQYVYTTEYSYDNHNNPLTYFEYDEDGETRENKTYTYEYDEKGNNIKETINDLYHNTVAYFTREYDENGNCTKFTLLKEDGSAHAVTDTVYDADGRILERTVTYPKDDLLPQVYKYTYDELGNLLTEFRQNESYGNNEAAFYEYSNYLYFYTPNK